MGAHPASGTTHTPAGHPDVAGEHMPEPVPDASSSAVSWSAVFAGATMAVAVSLLLTLLGSGLGFAAVSPWADHSGVVLGAGAILWLSFTQLAASALGGFLAGRLRATWTRIQDDEVHFRDTAHGLLSWAVATLVMALFFGGILGQMAGSVIDAPVDAATAALAQNAAATGPNGDAAHSPDYLVDVMLRSDRAGPPDPGLRQEAMRILASGVANGRLAVADRAWLTRRIAERSGLDREEAGKRVDDAFASSAAVAAKAKAAARESADSARKAAASTALWLTVTLLLGAFTASWCATLGGRMRDGLAATSRRHTTGA